jgi:hypothetical protein
VNAALVSRMWPIACTFSVFTTLWKKSIPRRSRREYRRPSRVPLRSLFSFVSTELARWLTRCSSRSEVTSDTRKGSYCEKFRVTKVTFTPHGAASTIQLVVWQFWGRAAEASLTEKSRALFYCVLDAWQSPRQRSHPERSRFSRRAKACPERSRRGSCAHRRSQN